MRHRCALLLDRGRLGVALDDDEPAQVGPVLAGDLVPHRLALVVAEGDAAIGARARRGRCPSGSRASGRGRSWPSPPCRRRSPCAGRSGCPGSRPGPSSFHQWMNFGCHDSSARCRRRSPARSTLLGILASMSTASSLTPSVRRSKSGREPVPKRRRAPSGPTALGRWKIQFCHAESRAKIFVSIVSGPTKRWLASSPVRASGEKLARSSSRTRTSSSQSMSSKRERHEPGVDGLGGGQVLAEQRRGPRRAASSCPQQRVAQPASGRSPSGTSRRWRRSAAAWPAPEDRRRPRTCPRASACGRRRAPARRACRRSSCPARPGRRACGPRRRAA